MKTLCCVWVDSLCNMLRMRRLSAALAMSSPMGDRARFGSVGKAAWEVSWLAPTALEVWAVVARAVKVVLVETSTTMTKSTYKCREPAST